jgi:endonuclease-3
VLRIHRRLAAAFGPLDPPPRRDPVEELILTVLSQNTNDHNRDRAFDAMRARWPSWEALAGASEGELADVIRPGGLANTKAPRILAILQEIRSREGAFGLAWMSRATDEEVESYLTSQPGVGPKTAACVLAFSLQRPAFPVDTHVFRVARRLGFYGDRTDAAHAHQALRAAVPPRLRVEMHVGMIRLGREVCRAGRPRCEVCPLLELCPTAPTVLARSAPTSPR